MRTTSFDPMTMHQARIGQTLREAYNDVTDRPLPDQLESLLTELDSIDLTHSSD